MRFSDAGDAAAARLEKEVGRGWGWGGGKGGFCFFVEAVMKGFLLSVGGVGDVSILSRLPSSPDGTFSFKILWDSLRFFKIL